jgi:GDP-D-mannose dehydratase
MLNDEKSPSQIARNRKVALITGVTGQDGAHLTRLLIDKGLTISTPIRMSITPAFFSITAI